MVGMKIVSIPIARFYSLPWSAEDQHEVRNSIEKRPTNARRSQLDVLDYPPAQSGLGRDPQLTLMRARGNPLGLVAGSERLSTEREITPFQFWATEINSYYIF
jgi:hypothetical protein